MTMEEMEKDVAERRVILEKLQRATTWIRDQQVKAADIAKHHSVQVVCGALPPEEKDQSERLARFAYARSKAFEEVLSVLGTP